MLLQPVMLQNQKEKFFRQEVSVIIVLVTVLKTFSTSLNMILVTIKALV